MSCSGKWIKKWLAWHLAGAMMMTPSRNLRHTLFLVSQCQTSTQTAWKRALGKVHNP